MLLIFSVAALSVGLYRLSSSGGGISPTRVHGLDKMDRDSAEEHDIQEMPNNTAHRKMEEREATGKV